MFALRLLGKLSNSRVRNGARLFASRPDVYTGGEFNKLIKRLELAYNTNTMKYNYANFKNIEKELGIIELLPKKKPKSRFVEIPDNSKINSFNDFDFHLG